MAQTSFTWPKAICCWAGASLVLIHACFAWRIRLRLLCSNVVKGRRWSPASDSPWLPSRALTAGESETLAEQGVFSHTVYRSHFGSSPLCQARYDLVMTFQKEWDTSHHPDNVKQYFCFNSVAAMKYQWLDCTVYRTGFWYSLHVVWSRVHCTWLESSYSLCWYVLPLL